MSTKKKCALAACLTLATMLAGCPPPDSSLVGAWKVHTYTCNQSMDNYGVAFLYANGSSELFIDAVYYAGDWELDGAIFSLTAIDLSGTGNDGTFVAAQNGNSLINGTWTVENTQGTGCWAAGKVAF